MQDKESANILLPLDPGIVLTMNDLGINHCCIVEGLRDHSPLFVYIIMTLWSYCWTRSEC